MGSWLFFRRPDPRNVIEEAFEEIVFQGLTEGLYLLWDTELDKPYAGQSKNLQRRMKEHVRDLKTDFNKVFARMPISIKEGVDDKLKDVLDAMEQHLIDLLREEEKGDIANKRNQINVHNPKRKDATAILKKIKMCD
jgi:predicted GIY-YIG superfamily endonuclease